MERRCRHCGMAFIPRRSTAIFCSSICRGRNRNRTSLKAGVSVRKTPRPVSPTRQGKSADFALRKPLKPKGSLHANSGTLKSYPPALPLRGDLAWIRVNDVTWKLTDGRMIRTPGVRGFWAGYDSEEALAWVIDVGWNAGKAAWVARYRPGGPGTADYSHGPTTLSEAKRVAEQMVMGTATDVIVVMTDPIRKLNQLTAALMDTRETPDSEPIQAQPWQTTGRPEVQKESRRLTRELMADRLDVPTFNRQLAELRP